MEKLSAKQIEMMKLQLLSQREELISLLSDSLESSRPVGLDQPIGRLSRMDALQQQSMTQASRRAAELRITKIDSALNRINRNEYGYCLACEETIGYGRLSAQPEASLCIDCQSQRELK